jgi:hypothetical protein
MPTRTETIPAVSFTVNVCNADAPYLLQTLRHMIRQLNFPFAERVATYDPGRQVGRYASRMQGTRTEVEGILETLLVERVVDRVDVIPWTEEDQRNIALKYFDDPDIESTDFRGAPIYQYLYAMNACSGDYLFHVDSDMLFYRQGERSWVHEALDLFRCEPQVIVATPQGGPPKARSRLERITGLSFERKAQSQWHRADSISTRYFLMDMARFRSCLPLQQAEPNESLEKTFFHTFTQNGYQRWSMNGYAHWAIHPFSHDENYLHYLDDLIWAVENGVYPFKRNGPQWDMYTEGEDINGWLAVLRKHGRSPN